MTTGMGRVLSLEEIEQAQAETRTRGVYRPFCKNFFESGELAVDVTTVPEFSQKEPGSLRNSLEQNCQKLRADGETVPEYKIMLVANGDKKHVLLVNMDVYHLEQAEKNEA